MTDETRPDAGQPAADDTAAPDSPREENPAPTALDPQSGPGTPEDLTTNEATADLGDDPEGTPNPYTGAEHVTQDSGVS